MRVMEIQLLGAASTVTGSQYLLTTARARILVDCGMFQGSPHEVVRNRVPLAYDPATVDAIVLTHAHLDHCGLIPPVVNEGFRGPVYATPGTIELATLVLLDSGKLQEEFAKRHEHWALRHPDKAAREEERDLQAIEQEIEEAQRTDLEGAVQLHGGPGGPAGGGGLPSVDELTLHDEQGMATRLGYPPVGHPGREDALAGAPPRPNLVVEEPLYDQADAKSALDRFRAVEYEHRIEVAPGITATFHDAGHILGSAIVELHVDDGEHPARTFVFSGDLGRTGAPILRDPTPLTAADYVFVESTYGGRLHDPQEESMRQLAEAVNDVVARQGVLLIPAFAIGRTQEMIWALNQLREAGRIPPVKLFLDSPMASKASAIYKKHVDYYDPETLEDLHAGEPPLGYPNQQETSQPQDSERVARAKRPYVIVASNGMLTGGRVLNHLRDVIGDSRCTILFVGYQGEGTLGARLQAGAASARIDGQEYPVRCQIRSIGGFSAHADEHELLAWLGNFVGGKAPGAPGVPRRVFIVHGDPEAQAAFEPKVRALGLPTAIPTWHERIRLD